MPQNNTACPICQEPRKQCAQQNCFNEFNSKERHFCDRCHDYHFESAPLQRCCYMEGGALACTSHPIKNTSTCVKHKHAEQKVKAWINHQKHLHQEITCVYHLPPSHTSSAFFAHGTNDHACANSFGIETRRPLPAAPQCSTRATHNEIYPQRLSQPPIGLRSKTPPNRFQFKEVEL